MLQKLRQENNELVGCQTRQKTTAWETIELLVVCVKPRTAELSRRKNEGNDCKWKEDIFGFHNRKLLSYQKEKNSKKFELLLTTFNNLQ